MFHSIAPVVCPYCGKKELVYMPEYRKCIIARILFYIFLILTCGFAIRFFEVTFWKQDQDYSDVFQGLLISSMVFAIVCRAIISILERKPHIKVICRDCGQNWLVK